MWWSHHATQWLHWVWQGMAAAMPWFQGENNGPFLGTGCYGGIGQAPFGGGAAIRPLNTIKILVAHLPKCNLSQ